MGRGDFILFVREIFYESSIFSIWLRRSALKASLLDVEVSRELIGVIVTRGINRRK